MVTTKKPVGRPRRSRKVSEARLVARCSDAELEAAESAAALIGESLSAFIRIAVAKRVRTMYEGRVNLTPHKPPMKWPPSKVDF